MNSRRTRALYALGAFHYDHVITAMAATFDEVSLQSRFELSPDRKDTLSRVPIAGDRIAQYAQRRARQPPALTGRRYGFGLGQFAGPALQLMGLHEPGVMSRAVIKRKASLVATHAVDLDLLQFEDGLGHVAMRRQLSHINVMERRGLHPSDPLARPEAIGGLVEQRRPDVMLDILEEEFAAADAIVTYSQVHAASLVQCGVDPLKIVQIPLPVNLRIRALPRRPERGVALFLGRLDTSKGIDVAAAAARASSEVTRLLVAGPAPNRAAREWLTSQPKVEYVGVASPDQIARLFAVAQLLLAPSVESFGLAALEAASCGLYVMCSNTTGVAEFLPEPGCTVVTSRDPLVWASAIDSFIASDDFAERPQFELPAALTVHAVQAKYEAFYRSTLDGVR